MTYRMGLIFRGLLFVAFCALIFTRYEVRDPKPEWATITVTAANAGYPFFNYYEPITEDNPLDKSKLDKFHSNDFGINFLVSYVAWIGQSFLGKDYQVSGATGRTILNILLCLQVLLYLSPTFPIVISLGGWLASVLFLLIWGDHYLASGNFEVRWVAGLAGIQMSMFLAGQVLGLARPFFKTTMAGLALMLSIFTLLRQDTQLHVFLAIFGSWLLFAWRHRDRLQFFKKAVPLGRWPLVSLIASYVVLIFVFKATLAFHYETNVFSQKVPTHGAGFPLWLGLGVFENPFNLTWQDETGYTQHRLYFSLPPDTYENNYQMLQKNTLVLFLKLIAYDPLVFFESIYKKAEFLVKFLIFPRIDSTNQEFFMLGLRYPDWTGVFMIPFAASLVGMLGVVGFGLAMPWAFFASLVLVASSFSAVIVYPGYPLPVLGAVFGIPFVLFPGAMLDLRKILIARNTQFRLSHFAELPKRHWRVGLILATLLVLVFVSNFVFHRIRDSQFQRDPRGELERNGAWAAFTFNRMEVQDQEAVIERLTERCSKLEPIEEGQDPLWVKYGDYNKDWLVFVLKRGTRWRKPEKIPRQGFSSSRVVVRTDGRSDFVGNNEYDQRTKFFLDLHDLQWDGRYQMILIPHDQNWDEPKELTISGHSKLTTDLVQAVSTSVFSVARMRSKSCTEQARSFSGKATAAGDSQSGGSLARGHAYFGSGVER